MEVNGQHEAQAALSLGEKPASTEKEAR